MDLGAVVGGVLCDVGALPGSFWEWLRKVHLVKVDI